MIREMSILILIILGTGLIFAESPPQSYEEAEILAEEYGIEMPNDYQEMEALAEQYGINESEVNSFEIPENLAEAEILAEKYGIEEIEFNSLAEQYINQFGCDGLEPHKENFLGFQIPEKVPYKNEIINLYVSDKIFGNFVIQEGIVSEFNCVDSTDSTYDIYLKDYSVILGFIGGFEKDVLLENLESEEIVVKGVGLGKKVKWFFSKIAMKHFM